MATAQTVPTTRGMSPPVNELKKILADHGLAAFFDGLLRMGVLTLRDVGELTLGDLEEIGMNRLQARRLQQKAATVNLDTNLFQRVTMALNSATLPAPGEDEEAYDPVPSRSTSVESRSSLWDVRSHSVGTSLFSRTSSRLSVVLSEFERLTTNAIVDAFADYGREVTPRSLGIGKCDLALRLDRPVQYANLLPGVLTWISSGGVVDATLTSKLLLFATKAQASLMELGVVELNSLCGQLSNEDQRHVQLIVVVPDEAGSEANNVANKHCVAVAAERHPDFLFVKAKVAGQDQALIGQGVQQDIQQSYMDRRPKPQPLGQHDVRLPTIVDRRASLDSLLSNRKMPETLREVCDPCVGTVPAPGAVRRGRSPFRREVSDPSTRETSRTVAQESMSHSRSGTRVGEAQGALATMDAPSFKPSAGFPTSLHGALVESRPLLRAPCSPFTTGTFEADGTLPRRRSPVPSSPATSIAPAIKLVPKTDQVSQCTPPGLLAKCSNNMSELLEVMDDFVLQRPGVRRWVTVFAAVAPLFVSLLVWLAHA